MSADDVRLQQALAALDRNRAALRARFIPEQAKPQETGPAKFPRSATFRWLLAAAGNRQLVGAALQTLFGKYPFGRLLAALVLGQRSR
ncbi:MAG: hypothetical protein ABSE43_05610 [Steroidobacteraceae bacterium]|jgi:hypothetical protein